MFRLNKYISVNILNLQGQKENWTNRKKSSKFHAERHDSFVFEQKPVKIDIFNDEEEREVKESVEKRKKKRHEVAEQNKALKRQKKQRKKNKMRQNYGLA